MELIEFLEARRRMNGKVLTYRQFANDLDVNFVTLHRFLKGKNELTVENIRNLAKAARDRGDKALLDALCRYALGIDDLELLTTYPQILTSYPQAGETRPEIE